LKRRDQSCRKLCADVGLEQALHGGWFGEGRIQLCRGVRHDLKQADRADR
jgi:hypothetical protein